MKKVEPRLPQYDTSEKVFPIAFVSVVMVMDHGQRRFATMKQGYEADLIALLEITKLDLYQDRRDKNAAAE